ncbi:MAG: tRNA uridine(34) 5-carboxymethylaminomethyl modification radical SAM/GNAT enzyme Elp3 [Candidatus Bathyarchaeota archaeon]
MITSDIYDEIAKELSKLKNLTEKDVNNVKIIVSKKYGLSFIPSNSEIVKRLPPEKARQLGTLLKKKKVRSISGVSVVTVMVKPHPCPKNPRCIYCPGGLDYGTPSAYTGREPACLRAIQNNYDPYLQVKNRINQLEAIGHVVDKVELIILGGNFTYLPKDYQEWFVKECLDALTNVMSSSIEEAKAYAETSKIKNSGITVETRPDICKEDQVNFLLNLGLTRVELGVQTIYEDVYKIIQRGHTVEDVVESFRACKDAGFTVTAHLMLNLPSSDFQKDFEMFRIVFSDERFKPDNIKIYPTLVLEDTKLYELWKNGKYQSYSEEEVIKLIIEAKKILPRWVRIQRIQRDIPANLIISGVKKSNLREIVLKEMWKNGLRCQCIRCREVGHVKAKFGLEPKSEDIKLRVEKYYASEGEEIFLSYEDVKQNILIGHIRLRYPSEKVFRPEVEGGKSLIIREIHVYGPLIPVGAKDVSGWQHQGYGKLLIGEAEKIAVEEYDAKKILILSALGVKGYYMKLGYKKDGVYMSKNLK